MAKSRTGSHATAGWDLRRRPPFDGVPATKAERNRFLGIVRDYVARRAPVPPLSLEELLAHTDSLAEETRLGGKYRNFLTVLLNNEVWKAQVAGFPYNRRLLLLPKCLRNEAVCPAEFDEFGLLCERCGGCQIGDLSAEAERLGYVVMVAEGSPVVMSLIETGQVNAVVGVSCLSVLERVFPYMEAGAVPGIAVPLLNEGCRATSVDLDWVWDAIHLAGDDPARALDLDGLRARVDGWFAADALEELLGPPSGSTEEIAVAWLAGAGKRWRPFLAACAYQAFQEDLEGALPGELRAAAVAVECFHKASLVHDDIEDGDGQRYGEKTLHERYGVPVALNVGDYLLGEGYRLLATTGAPAESTAAMLRAVAEGHRTLCLGQGAELCWMRDPAPLSPAQVLDIFRRKTAPAFEVALRVGATLAGRGGDLGDVLRDYSANIGIAYQIRDDLEDYGAEHGDLAAFRPSLLLSLAYQNAKGRDRNLLEAVWRRSRRPAEVGGRLESLLAELGAEEAAGELLDVYKSEAIRALCALENPHLKGLLRRVVGRIFGEIEFMGCCNDHQAGDAAGGERGSEAAA